MMPPRGFIKEYWSQFGCSCLLCRGEGQLELRLYQRGDLVALVPFDDPLDAFELAQEWRVRRPMWWPPFIATRHSRA